MNQTCKNLISRSPKMSREEALSDGYKALTTVYLREDHGLLCNVIQDMRKGNVDYTLVETDYDDEYEVWRKGMMTDEQFSNFLHSGKAK